MIHECHATKEGFAPSFETRGSDPVGFVKCRYCRELVRLDEALGSYFAALDSRLGPVGAIVAKPGEVIYFDPKMITIERNTIGDGMTVRIKETS
jgi:hypothetical protein